MALIIVVLYIANLWNYSITSTSEKNLKSTKKRYMYDEMESNDGKDTMIESLT